MVSGWRARWARRLDPGAGMPARAYEQPALPAAPPPNPWPELTNQFAMRLLGLVETLRPELDQLESDEEDPERLARLYRVDHGLTRLRRTAGYLGVLAGVDPGKINAVQAASLVDVIREAESAIEHYTRVAIGRVIELGVVEHATRDVAWLLAALLENGTLYSSGAVTVSAWLLPDGGVLMRVEDTGIGIRPHQVASINGMLDGPVREVDGDTGLHTGLAVAHRLARRHGIGLRLVTREPSGSDGTGTVAMIAIPPALLCELPVGTPGARPAITAGPGGQVRGTAQVPVEQSRGTAQVPAGQSRGTAQVPAGPPRLSIVSGGADPSAGTPPASAPPAPMPVPLPSSMPAPGDDDPGSGPAADEAGPAPGDTELQWPPPPTAAISQLRPDRPDRPEPVARPDAAELPRRARPNGPELGPWHVVGPVDGDSAARREFAADLEAFTAGEREARQQSGAPAGGGRGDRGETS